MTLHTANPSPRRSVLYVPAINARALAKTADIDCDALIFDLEDAVAPEKKEEARHNLIQLFDGNRPARQELVIRVNAIGSDDFAQDVAAVAQCRPDAMLVPKVSTACDWDVVANALDAHRVDSLMKLWAMVETPAALTAIDEIVRAGMRMRQGLDGLVVGTNDIAKDTGVSPGDGRRYLIPWLMRIVLCAKHHGICVLDGVWNDFADTTGYEAELQQSRKMGFDGKTLIHPSQVASANREFSPSDAAVATAREIVAAFSLPEHASAGVIQLGGKMVERLHLEQARRLLALHEAIDARAGRRREGAG